METQGNYNHPQGQQPNPYQQQVQQQAQSNLPNASTSMVLGILSLVLCGPIGLVLGIIAMSLSKKDKQLYDANPSLYTAASVSNLTTAKTCGLIGVILSSLVLLFFILYFIFVFAMIGTMASAIPDTY